ncbi:hypothetical protein BH09ACT3_BH09ACT3_14920 [soil metagenome]
MSASREAELSARILREAREELVRADGKASLLLAAASVVAAAVLAAILAGDWRPSELRDFLQVAWWLGTAAGLTALVCLSMAVYPRTSYRRRRPDGLVAFFGDVVGLSAKELERRLKVSAKTEAPIIDQLIAVSGIVHRKYRRIQIGLWLFGGAAVLCIGAVVADRFLG